MGGELAEDEERAEFCAGILKALGHPVRLRIIAILAQGPEHVTGLAEQLEMPQPAVSQQLQVLRRQRLVFAEREDGFAVYRLAEPRLKRLLKCLEGWEG